MNKSLLFVVLLLTLTVSSCSKIEVGVVSPTPDNGIAASPTPAGQSTASTVTSTPDVQPEASPTLTSVPPTSPQPDSSAYWSIQQDPGLGFRFALPCFWRVDFPASGSYDLEAGSLYHAFNYPEDYPLSFPRSQIPAENGAVNVTFDLINILSQGLPAGSSLREFVLLENSAGDSEILEMKDETINAQPALSVTIDYPDTNSTGRYYLIKASDQFLLRFSVFPSPKLLNTPDIAGILNSITFDSQAEVPLPAHTPAPPPLGLAAPCIPDYSQEVIPTVEIPVENTTCGLDSYQSLDFLTEAVQAGLQDRNTGGLRWDYLIHDPFVVAYWGGTSESMTPDLVATLLANSLYDAAQPGGMTFTSDRAAFPTLNGNPPEDLISPEVNIVQVVYSQGWGLDGLGAAFLYFAQDECSGFYWYGLVFSQSPFD
jgi:hypothetical protein